MTCSPPTDLHTLRYKVVSVNDWLDTSIRQGDPWGSPRKRFEVVVHWRKNTNTRVAEFCLWQGGCPFAGIISAARTMPLQLGPHAPPAPPHAHRTAPRAPCAPP